jgi:hypothetical protein
MIYGSAKIEQKLMLLAQKVKTKKDVPHKKLWKKLPPPLFITLCFSAWNPESLCPG